MANRSVNSVTLLGTIGRDAETSFTGSQKAIVKFSVATNNRYKGSDGEWKEDTNWTNVIFWNGDKVAPYLTKGTRVYLEGRLQTRNYENKEGQKVYVTEVVANDVILLGGNEKREEAPASAPKAKSAPVSISSGGFDDDVPFSPICDKA